MTPSLCLPEGISFIFERCLLHMQFFPFFSSFNVSYSFSIEVKSYLLLGKKKARCDFPKGTVWWVEKTVIKPYTTVFTIEKKIRSIWVMRLFAKFYCIPEENDYVRELKLVEVMPSQLLKSLYTVTHLIIRIHL